MSQKQYAYFSAAIREGAKLSKQGFALMFSGGRTCALGAGAQAMGMGCDVGYCEVAEAFPYLEETRLRCSLEGCDFSLSEMQLGSMLAHLNDQHRWSREAIADWLYAEEEKLGFITLLETEQDTESDASSAVSNVTEAEVCSSLT